MAKYGENLFLFIFPLGGCWHIFWVVLWWNFVKKKSLHKKSKNEWYILKIFSLSGALFYDFERYHYQWFFTKLHQHLIKRCYNQIKLLNDWVISIFTIEFSSSSILLLPHKKWNFCKCINILCSISSSKKFLM
jgi:hypothetical protein